MLGRRVRGDDDDAEAVRPGTRPGHEIPGSRALIGAAPRVLLIDDRIPADDAFVHLLTRRGVAVTCAETGTRGLELAVAGPWAAVLLDLHLPDLPGLAVLSRLRAAGVHVPEIVITGWYGDGDHEAAAEALGAAAFLRWPVDIDEVVAELEAVRRPRATPAPGSDDLHGARDAPLSRTERVTLADLVDVLQPAIERALRGACPLADPDHVTDAAVDALLEARRSLARFDPTRGVSFAQWVGLAARRNLLNRLRAERRRRAREDRYARGATAAVGPADDDEPGEDAAALVGCAVRRVGCRAHRPAPPRSSPQSQGMDAGAGIRPSGIRATGDRWCASRAPAHRASSSSTPRVPGLGRTR
ncbi:MAG: response regulator [Acidobacteria bacterium]|nr:response regulator [Acidobacteriota bacterium]